MAEVTGFWSEAIRAGVKALDFSTRELPSGPQMHAEIAKENIPAPVRRAAAAAIAVDKEIGCSKHITGIALARAALSASIRISAAGAQLENYQRLLAVEVLKRVAPDPPALLKALSEPYE